MNIIIKHNNEVGRYATAGVDLNPGDFIFSETSFAFGPKSDSPVLCLGCYVPIDATTLCASCKWPVCGKDCETNPAHKTAECDVFTKASVRFQKIPDMTQPCLQYECITPLRVLVAMLRNNDVWTRDVKIMEAHNVKRKNHCIWKFNQINIVNYLRGPCGLKMFDEELIHTVCGILECNAFEARSTSGYPIRCLFPKLAVLSHNCISNITHTIISNDNDDFRVIVKAATEVKKDEELFSSYTYSLWPTILRREHLNESKYFNCTCDRCSDPTEIGTHVSSLICNQCNIGIVTPSAPLANENWKCSNCDQSVSHKKVKSLFQTIQNEVDTSDIQHLPEIIEKYSDILHPHNYFLVSMKLSLIPTYRHLNVYKAIQFCKDVLQILNIIEPGWTRIRSTTLYELALATFTLIRHLQTQKRQELIGIELQHALKYLEECVPVLIQEPDYTLEGQNGLIAFNQLTNLKNNFENVINGYNIFDVVNI